MAKRHRAIVETRRRVNFWDFFPGSWYGLLLRDVPDEWSARCRDLFRDDSLNGWLKAVWMLIALVLVPSPALIYLIVRGRGMAERQFSEMAGARARRRVHPVGSRPVLRPTDRLRQESAGLGRLTQAEFDRLKAKALA